MTPAAIVAMLLALAVVVASGRWLGRAWRDEATARPRAWRLAALLALQAGAAVALFYLLFPPPGEQTAATLVVLTSGVTEQQRARIGSSEIVVSMPEAPVVPGIARAPDVGTALRQHPGTTQLRVLGHGLSERDRDAVGNRAVEFDPAPLPVGIIELQAPTSAIAGAPWRISGRVNGAAKGSIEFLDPAGQRLARQTLAADGAFAFATTARTPGRSLFQLRLRDAGGAVLEDLNLPLSTVAGTRPRVRIMAGAPSPELKYLRRWASDAGLRLGSEILLSPGVRMADAARFDAATLAATDLVILDDRVWSSLGEAQRAVLIEALRGGLGVVLRITAPLAERDRRSLSELGIAVAESDQTHAVKLTATTAVVEAPMLNRRPLKVEAADGAVLLRDERGEPLSIWRQEGRGRIALWWLSDSYALVLAGQGSTHAALWSEASATVARTGSASPTPELTTLDPRVQQRLLWCDLGGDAQVLAPDGASTRLRPSGAPGRSCAAYWPVAPGWHWLQQGDSAVPFVVRDRGEAPGLAAFARQQATRQQQARASTKADASAHRHAGSRWPWLGVWLALSAALWGLERSRWGRATGA